MNLQNSSNISTYMQDLLTNEERLKVFETLQDNWNNNDANPFSDILINKIKMILPFLKIQPEIFPTACNSIQLEYDREDGSYMEIEITESDTAEVFILDTNTGQEILSIMNVDIESLNEVVSQFYGDTCMYE